LKHRDIQSDLDGMLAGGSIDALSKYGANDTLYLLSDFSTTHSGAHLKLIGEIAMSRDLIGPLAKRNLWCFREDFTAAFTHKPGSRGCHRGCFLEEGGGRAARRHGQLRGPGQRHDRHADLRLMVDFARRQEGPSEISRNPYFANPTRSY
jgi:hypothetical protein